MRLIYCLDVEFFSMRIERQNLMKRFCEDPFEGHLAQKGITVACLLARLIINLASSIFSLINQTSFVTILAVLTAPGHEVCSLPAKEFHL